MSGRPASLFPSSTMSTVISSFTSIPSTTTHHLTTGTIASATPTQTATSNPSPTSSPLLFFVALGFGVVFTNLWIIVGVKYCFRYNARNRQLREAGENGEPIDLANMPGRPHRRRREKKLMSMEEVNERFPLVKYKTWRATQEHEGLPATGGVTAPPSRAASIKDGIPPLAQPVQPAEMPASASDLPADTRDFAATETPGVLPAEKHESGIGPNTNEAHINVPASPSTGPKSPNFGDVEEDEDDPIRTAVPAELLTQPGDACAICIDNIDDDDEVRGLTCGHAFHAGCLDPWLTSRRACCPLCKADYYVPKPRPEGEAAADAAAVNLPTMPRQPNVVWHGGAAFRTRSSVPRFGSRTVFDSFDRYSFPTRNTRGGQGSRNAEQQSATNEAAPSNFRTRAMAPFRWGSGPTRMPGFLRRGQNDNQATPAAADAPGQLEAGHGQS